MPYLNSSTLFMDGAWILWFGFVFLLFSSMGNWGYAYRAHRKLNGAARKDASALLDERYARGEVTRTQYLEMKKDIASA